MSVLAGLTLIYLIPGGFAVLFWFGPVKRLIAHWTHRDLMLSLIPKPQHVHHTETLLGLMRFTRDRT